MVSVDSVCVLLDERDNGLNQGDRPPYVLTVEERDDGDANPDASTSVRPQRVDPV